MGKASKWFKGLLGIKNSADPHRNQAPKPPSKKKWSFAKPHKEKDRQKPHHDTVPSVEDDDEASKNAIAVAAATAAVSEAAVAAAQAAAAVVQLTSSGRNISVPGRGGAANATASCFTRRDAGYRSLEEWAAVTVQSHFRAYLCRRALRALKALVKLQALVRGHLVRKQTAYALRRLHALVRAQARARTGQGLVAESPHSSIKSSRFNYLGPVTPEKYEHAIRARSMKHQQLMMFQRNGSKSRGCANYDPEKSRVNCTWMDSRMGTERLCEQGSFTGTLPTDDDDDATGKILEVDTGNSYITAKRRSLVHSSHLNLGSDKNCRSFPAPKDSKDCHSVLSPSSGEVQSLSPLNLAQDIDEAALCAADNSPTFHSASSRGGSSAFTPAKSEGTRSCLSVYSDQPNYMAYTESSKAKVRSLSVPKQRPHFERLGSTKIYSVQAYGDLRSTQKASALHANFTNKAYPGSGHLDRLGMPIRGDVAGFRSGGPWQRYW